MNIRLLALAGLAISFALPTFAQQKDTADPQITEQLKALSKKTDEANNNGDAAAVAALYTEDAVQVTHRDGTFHGREAIEKSYAHRFQRWHPSNYVSTIDRLIAVGEGRGFGGRCCPRSFVGSCDTFSSFAHTGGRYHPRSSATNANFAFAGV